MAPCMGPTSHGRVYSPVGRPVSRKAGRKKAPPSVSALGLLHLMDVSLKASLTLSSLAFFEIIKHFLSFGKY